MNVSPTKISWRAMRARCTNPNVHNYQRYGGSGVKVCERWMTYENFLADMGERPPGTTLDRFPNRKGDYEPGNCRWATDEQQYENRDKFFVDETGARYGRLLVVSRAESIKNTVYWNCVCDCGATTKRRGATLRAGDANSCGCLRKGPKRGPKSLQRVAHVT